MAESTKFVPAGYRGVLRGPKGAGWYVTTQNTPVDAAVPATCPITGERVMSVTVGTHTLFFRQDAVIDTTPREIPQMSFLNYDIPSDSDIPNPSGRLRRFAVRTTLSAWVVPTNAVPWTLINELREAGATVTLYKFDVSEGPILLNAVENALRAQIREAAQSAEESAESAAQQYAESDKPNRGKYFEQRIKTAHKQAAERLEAYQEAAKVFGLDPRVLGVQAAMGTAQAIQTGIYVRAEKYAAAAAALRAANTPTATALADAAARDEVPAGVLADALRDHNLDADADSLQAAFTDDTFSLASVDDE